MLIYQSIPFDFSVKNSSEVWYIFHKRRRERISDKFRDMRRISELIEKYQG